IGKINEEDLKNAILAGYVSGIGDKYSDFLTAEEYSSYVAEQSGSKVGIGINVIFDSSNLTIEILDVTEGGPADKAGVLPGDFVVAVNGENVSVLGYYGTVNAMRGQPGEEVTVTFARGESTYEKTLAREAVAVRTVSYHALTTEPDIGFVRLTEFNGTTPDQFAEALDSLKASGCKGLVIDLRNNGGGELTSILRVLDTILPEGPIVHIYMANGREEHYTSESSFVDMPICVLVNGRTASAAELFASAVADYASEGKIKAATVGTTTYGKGVLQTYFTLGNGSAFKISVGRYDPPYSQNYDGVGVVPSIVSELSEEQESLGVYRLTDDNDDQLAAAVRWLKENI
ncbi:MAG: PDZ domain-containing protein, partial [Clostridia bacterium]|nr:PDZ domain-containing protein [Clostridia bacterium]